MNLTALPAFADNPLWMLDDGARAIVDLDRGESRPVVEALDARRLQLAAILVTHRHAAAKAAPPAFAGGAAFSTWKNEFR